LFDYRKHSYFGFYIYMHLIEFYMFRLLHCTRFMMRMPDTMVSE